ncbi:MAG: glycine cleavage system protein GcvH [Pseudomonadota bacterium]|nr:glycine cleavage system protein GcvH [Pseudomonadota bacterium]
MSLYFSKEHEWVRVDGEVATVGISDHAQAALGDIVFAEAPDAGKILARGDEAAVVESVKAASDVYAPVGGTVTEANAALGEDPAIVNRDPEGEGWFFRLTLSDPSEVAELMDESAYREWCKTL